MSESRRSLLLPSVGLPALTLFERLWDGDNILPAPAVVLCAVRLQHCLMRELLCCWLYLSSLLHQSRALPVRGLPQDAHSSECSEYDVLQCLALVVLSADGSLSCCLAPTSPKVS